MKGIFGLAGLVVAVLSSAIPTTSHAQSFFRTFVSGLGNDGNPCTRTQPCQTFTRALAQTFSGGEIDVLDPGGYGPFTITKAISIVNDGVGTVGVKAASGGNGIVINAGPSDAINLRGLTIEVAGIGSTGIAFNSGQMLMITKSVVRNFTGSGIAFAPTSNGNPSAGLLVSECLIANNAGHGVYVQPTGAVTVKASFSNVQAYQNGLKGIGIYGNLASQAVYGFVVNSVASGSGEDGFYVLGGHDTSTYLFIERSVANGNSGAGIRADDNGGPATARASETNLKGNAAPWIGDVASYGNNAAVGVAPPSGSALPRT